MTYYTDMKPGHHIEVLYKKYRQHGQKLASIYAYIPSTALNMAVYLGNDYHDMGWHG